MKSLLSKIIAALIVVAALGGCAATGGQEGVTEFLDRTNETATTE